MKRKRILVTGPSGMGKTTLAQKLAKEYNLPFVGVSIKEICKFFGYDFATHQDIIDFMKLNPTEGFKLQYELLKARQLAFGDRYSSGFVTDRGHIDSMVYTWNQVFEHMKSEKDVAILLDKMNRKVRSVHRLFTHIIYLSWIDGWEIEDDGVRVADPSFQISSNWRYMNTLKGIMDMALEDMEQNKVYGSGGVFPYVLMLQEKNFEQRLTICKTFIENYG